MKYLKRFFHAFIMCQTMFISIPIPARIWDEDARRDMLLFLPVIGLEAGLLWYLIGLLCEALGLPAGIEALILCAFPYIITGAIHMDGFMDVTDAVCSWRDIKRRREILHDPHAGSFAVLGCVLVLLSGYALLSEGLGDLRTLIFIPIISRSCSALAVLNIRPITESEYAETFRRSLPRTCAIAVLLASASVLSFVFCGKYALLSAAGILGYAAALATGAGRLGGMNGDIAGFSLVISELAAVALCVLL